MAKADRPWWIGKGPGPDYTGLGPGAARPGHRAREPRTAAPRWPLGTHAGELCNRDRALLFEDPTGVRVLYDPGQSLTGADDPRLGAVHVVLLNHAHADHIGDAKLTAVGAGTCAQPALAPAGANSLTAEIIAAKHSAIMMVRELGVFVGKRVGNIVGQARGVDITVVQAAHASNPPRSEMK